MLLAQIIRLAQKGLHKPHAITTACASQDQGLNHPRPPSPPAKNKWHTPQPHAYLWIGSTMPTALDYLTTLISPIDHMPSLQKRRRRPKEHTRKTRMWRTQSILANDQSENTCCTVAVEETVSLGCMHPRKNSKPFFHLPLQFPSNFHCIATCKCGYF